MSCKQHLLGRQQLLLLALHLLLLQLAAVLQGTMIMLMLTCRLYMLAAALAEQPPLPMHLGQEQANHLSAVQTVQVQHSRSQHLCYKTVKQQ